jgi:hypothetical protein
MKKLIQNEIRILKSSKGDALFFTGFGLTMGIASLILLFCK